MKILTTLLIVLLLYPLSVNGEEGMWLLNQIDQLNLKKAGLKIKTSDIYSGETSISNAIVHLGGCSSSFVSQDGLILTNHHCAFGALQRASKEDSDYITNGFLAKTRAEELQAHGMHAYVLQETRDVTAEILEAGEGIEDVVERDKKIKTAIKEMTEAIEGDRDDIRARIAEMYNGKQYILFVDKKYQDLRIVFAPPRSIGNYGDEIDNWMWPRHTGDFTYLRVYMAPDGSGAKYSPDNVPVKPKSWLKISTRDLKDGDFTFILGFPGQTTRWRTSNSVRWNLKYNYPETVQDFGEVLDILDEYTKDSEEGKIRVAGLKAGLENTLKNYQGRIEGMTKTHFLDKKVAFENKLMTFINADPDLYKTYGNVLKNIEAIYAELKETKPLDDALTKLRFSGTLAGIATQIYGHAREREKPEEERDPSFSEKNLDETKERLKLRYYGYYENVDRALLTRALNNLAELPEEITLHELDDILADIDGFVNKAYSDPKLADAEYAVSLFEKTSEELEAMNDPFFTLAADLYSTRDEQNDRTDSFNAKIISLRKTYLDALYEWKGTGLYPDANNTLRFTYGHVAGYKPADAVWYDPFTTLKGVIEKNTGIVPFNMPAKLQTLYKNRDFGQWMDPELNDISVNFLHRCDITGGNSGSAVMNARGELIGLAFDGNYEAMTSDWQYDYDMQRTIAVDIRYVMFITEKIAGADYLLKEMGLK